MPEKLPITLITQFYNTMLSSEPGWETKMLDQLRPVVDQICCVVQESFDDTIHVVKDYTSDILLQECIWHPEPYRNLLLDMAKNEWILFLDPDMHFDGDDVAGGLRKLIEQNDFDAWKFARNDFNAAGRSSPGTHSGTTPVNQGQVYLFKKSMCHGSPPLLHYPYVIDPAARIGEADLVVNHRALHEATERWKIYYPFNVWRLAQAHKNNPQYMDMLNRVSGCHYACHHSGLGKGLPSGIADTTNGVRVLFIGGRPGSQTWPWVVYADNAEDFNAHDFHIIINGDSRISYHPRFVERSLELFSLFQFAEGVRCRWAGIAPDGMSPMAVNSACTLRLAQLKDKPASDLQVVEIPLTLARGSRY